MPATSPRSTRRRRRSRNFVAIPVNLELGLAALGSKIVKTTGMTALTQQIYAISADLIWSIRDHTQNEGPLLVGLASGALTSTQMKEAIEAIQLSSADRINKEHATRPLRRAGVFTLQNVNENVLNNGLAIRTRLRFPLADADNVNMFVYNSSGATLTTGAVVAAFGKIYANWQ